MSTYTKVADTPNVPAIYALYGRTAKTYYVAYVGLGSKLKQRLTQHLIRRDSSVTTGVAAACLNPDVVGKVCWWESDYFSDAGALKAAEIIAFDLLNPTLRSRGGVETVTNRYPDDEQFNSEMNKLISGSPSGTLILRNLEDVLERLDHHEELISRLESRIAQLEE